MPNPKLELIPITGIPEIKEGDDLSQIIVDGLKSSAIELAEKELKGMRVCRQAKAVWMEKFMACCRGWVVSVFCEPVSEFPIDAGSTP